MAIHTIYVGRKADCGCIVAASIEPDGVADMARHGLIISTVRSEYVTVSGCSHRLVVDYERDPKTGEVFTVQKPEILRDLK